MITGEKIRQAREALGMSQRALADKVGITQPAIRKIESGDSVRSRFLPDVLRAVGLQEDRPEAATVLQAPVVATAGAGLWQEPGVLDDHYQQPVPYVPDRFPGVEQVAYRVVGDSVDMLRLFDGDYAVCVPYSRVRHAPNDGDLVVVERRRDGATEITIKQLKTTQEGYELWPRSSNPRWQTPLKVSRNWEPDDHSVVEIVGLVIGRYSPL